MCIACSHTHPTFVFFSLGIDIRAVLDEVTLHQETLQIRFKSLGNKIPFRFTKCKTHDVDMRLSQIPSGVNRDGFDFIPKESQRLIELINSANPPKVVPILASSAQGKTRLMFDVAHAVFCIYVELNTGKEERADKEEESDHAFAETCSLIRKVDVATVSKVHRTEAAHRVLQADLAARLFLLLTYLKVEETNPSPRTFLLLQLDTGNAMIASTSVKLVHSEMNLAELLVELDADINALLRERSGQYCVCIDEAQVGVSLFGIDSYKAKSFAFSHTTLPPTSVDTVGHLLDTYSRTASGLDNCCSVIIAGTGYTSTMSSSVLSTIPGTGTEPFIAPAMPFLTENDILHRWNYVLDMNGINCDDVKFRTLLRNLTGRPRWSSSVIQTHLLKAINAKPQANKTEQLVSAMKSAYIAAKLSLSTMYRKYNASSSEAQKLELHNMLQRAHAYYTVVSKDDNRHLINSLFDGDVLQRSVVAGLCHVVECKRGVSSISTGSASSSSTSSASPSSTAGEPYTEVTFSEPALRSVVMALGKLYSWSASDTFTKYIFRAHAYGDGRKNYEFEYLCGLLLVKMTGDNVGEFVRSFLRNDNGVSDISKYLHRDAGKTVNLPAWVDTTNFKFGDFAMYRSSSPREDIDHINCAFSGDKEWMDKIFMPADMFRPDLLAINPTENFGVAVSIKLKSRPLGLQDKLDDLKSTSVEGFNNIKDVEAAVKASTGKGLPEQTKKNLIGLNWLRIHITIPNITCNIKGQHNVVVSKNDVIVNINETNYRTFFGEDTDVTKALTNFLLKNM